MRFDIDMLRRVLAVIIYVIGVCVVLYVAYVLRYSNPEGDKSMYVISNWGLLVTGMACILVAPVLWAVRFSSKGSHNDERLEDEKV